MPVQHDEEVIAIGSQRWHEFWNADESRNLLNDVDLTLPENWSSRLCRRCHKIDFGALRCPTLQESEDMSLGRAMVPPHRFDVVDLYPPPIALGTLRRVKSSAARCPSCELVWSIIVRENSGEEPEFTSSDTGASERECFVHLHPYLQFSPRGPHSSSTVLPSKSNLVRRLSLRIGWPPAPDEDDVECLWWTIHFCIQATVPGISGLNSSTQAPLSPSQIVFAYGGRIRPLVLDTSRIRQWFDLCTAEHGQKCSFNMLTSNRDPTPTATDPHPELRLINIPSECIEAFGSSSECVALQVPPYVALSYVWGFDQRLKLRKANEQELMVVGAFSVNRPSRTIIDAIELLKQLDLPGIKHLWVDALCILQDSDDDKARQIQKMDQTYTNSALTIVAEAGEDADCGLPGLSVGTRSMKQSIVELIPPGCTTYGDGGVINHKHGLALMSTISPLPEQNTDFWNLGKYATRGWTMQERVLSRRRLIFTREQVFWQCTSATYCEESHMESAFSDFDFSYPGAKAEASIEETLQLMSTMASDHDDGKDPSRHQGVADEDLPWNRLAGLASDYTTAEFTNEGDIVDGFSGVLNVMSRVANEEFHWGLPVSRFSSALLWSNRNDDNGYIRRRTERTTLPVTTAERQLRVPSWSWLAWAGVSVNFAARLHGVYDPELVCFIHRPGGTSLRRLTQQDIIPRKESAAFPSQSQHPLWEVSANREVTMAHMRSELPGLHERLPSIPEGILVYFWTSFSTFRVEYDDIRRQYRILGQSPSVSVDSTAWRIKKVEPIDGVDQYWVGTMTSGTDTNLRQTLENPHGDLDIVDFIVVGRDSVASKISTVLVMAIAWHASGVAIRLALGTINEDAWNASRPAWRLIALG